MQSRSDGAGETGGLRPGRPGRQHPVPRPGRRNVFRPLLAVHLSFAIDPPVAVQTRIESMQINGFVFDAEGNVETLRDGRTRPAEKWDEKRTSHQMYPLANGGFTKQLALSATGGHEHNGVYQFLFSANGNGDWGYCAVNGQPGRLAGGCGYSSRVGRIDELAVVIWYHVTTNTPSPCFPMNTATPLIRRSKPSTHCRRSN